MADYPNLAELAQGVEIPPHLLAVLHRQEYSSIDELRSDIATADESERDAVWGKSDRCALMRALLPYSNPNGTTNRTGRKVVGWLASDLGVSGQTIRRYMGLGLHYPPQVIHPETGEVTTVRDPATPLNIYTTGLKALDHDLSPLTAVLLAIQNGWSAGQLRKWIENESYRDSGETPPVNRVWYREQINDPTSLEDISALFEEALQIADEELRRLAVRDQDPLLVRVTIMALEPGEEL